MKRGFIKIKINHIKNTRNTITAIIDQSNKDKWTAGKDGTM